MPTPEEIQALRNQELARAVASGTLSAGPQVHKGPEQTPAEAREKWEGYEPELSDVEVQQRMGEAPQEQPTFEGIVQRMAQNYQTSPQYAQLLEQELVQISAQIAELTQRRNMIEMARRGQG
jgi:hypothetical protein